MTQNTTICVGTLGQGIWRSSDGGDTWLRVRHGLYSESAVRALAVHPSDARVMYCGADSGVYRSEDSGEHWERLDSPMHRSWHFASWSLSFCYDAYPETPRAFRTASPIGTKGFSSGVARNIRL